MASHEAADERAMELYVYGPAFGLPTFHADCLVVVAYVRFAGLEASVAVTECTNPSMSPTGELPFLRNGDTLVGGAGPIVAYLKRRGDNLDFRLTPRENADARAYSALVSEELNRCLLYNWWAEEENYSALTSRVYALDKPFPLSYLLPNSQRDTTVAMLKSSGYADEAVYARSNEIYIALAERLGASSFFGGDVPCTLDAVAFGHLFVAYLAPMPVAHLSFQITTHPNLVKYMQMVYKLFWHLDLGSSPAFASPSPLRSEAAVRAWSSSPRASPTKKRRDTSPAHSDFFDGDAGVDDDEHMASAEAGAKDATSKVEQERALFAKRTRMFVAVGITSVVAYVLLYLGGNVAGVSVDGNADDE